MERTVIERLIGGDGAKGLPVGAGSAAERLRWEREVRSYEEDR